MSLAKLGSIAVRFAHRQPLFRRLTAHETKTFCILKNNNSTVSAKTKTEEEDDLDKPIRYSTSGAAKWDPVASRTGSTDDEVLWYQPWVIMTSLAIFMIYFFILREENDIDEKLTRNLSDHFQGEARRQLEASQMIAHNYVKQGSTAFKKPSSS